MSNESSHIIALCVGHNCNLLSLKKSVNDKRWFIIDYRKQHKWQVNSANWLVCVHEEGEEEEKEKRRSKRKKEQWERKLLSIVRFVLYWFHSKSHTVKLWHSRQLVQPNVSDTVYQSVSTTTGRLYVFYFDFFSLFLTRKSCFFITSHSLFFFFSLSASVSCENVFLPQTVK